MRVSVFSFPLFLYVRLYPYVCMLPFFRVPVDTRSGVLKKMIEINCTADVNETVTWNVPKYAYKKICSVRLSTQKYFSLFLTLKSHYIFILAGVLKCRVTQLNCQIRRMHTRFCGHKSVGL